MLCVLMWKLSAHCGDGCGKILAHKLVKDFMLDIMLRANACISFGSTVLARLLPISSMSVGAAPPSAIDVAMLWMDVIILSGTLA